jgi:hypothetical protein
MITFIINMRSHEFNTGVLQASAYQTLFVGQSALASAKQLWRTRVPNSCRMFFWLALLGRCGASLEHHGLPNHGPCALCSQEDETIEHLLVRCVVSREVWFKPLRRFSWQRVAPRQFQDTDVVNWWLQARKQIKKRKWKAFDSLVVLVAWCTWLQRNTCIFRDESRLPASLVDVVLIEFDLLV